MLRAAVQGDAHSAADGGPVSQQLGQVEGAGRGEETGEGARAEGEGGERESVRAKVVGLEIGEKKKD